MDRQEFNQDHDKDLWKGVWALQTPNKLRNFVWRDCRNTLPSKKNLVRCTIITNPTCDRCSLAIRKILCMLYELAPNSMLSGLIPNYGILEAKLISKISSSSQHGCSSMPRIQICLPQLLEPSGINETIFDYTKCCTTDQLSRVSKDHYEEFKAISPARTPKPWQTRVTWKPPPLDSFKINYDVAVFTENNNFGTVVINTENNNFGTVVIN